VVPTMRLQGNKPLSDYLLGLPSPTRVSSGFSSAPLVFTFQGPHRFYRAIRTDLAAKSVEEDFGGAFWAEENVLVQIALEIERSEDWKHPMEGSHAWPLYLRALTALQTDWNSSCRILALQLPLGNKIDALLGFPYLSPNFFAKEPDGQAVLYPVRVEQLFIKWTPTSWIFEVPLW
jgi:hypothetical protein